MKMTMLVMITMKQRQSLAKDSQGDERAAGAEKGDKEIATETKLIRLWFKLPTAILKYLQVVDL